MCVCVNQAENTGQMTVLKAFTNIVKGSLVQVFSKSLKRHVLPETLNKRTDNASHLPALLDMSAYATGALE